MKDLFIDTNLKDYNSNKESISNDQLVVINDSESLVIGGNEYKFVPSNSTEPGQVLSKDGWKKPNFASYEDPDTSNLLTKDELKDYQPKGDYLTAHQSTASLVTKEVANEKLNKEIETIEIDLASLENYDKMIDISEEDFAALGVENMETNVQYNIYGKQIELGEIYVYNKITKQKSFVSIDVLETLDSEVYEPIGIVVIPSSHNVYGNGNPGIMGLKLLSVITPDTGTIANETIPFMNHFDNTSSLNIRTNLDRHQYENTPNITNTSQTNIKGYYHSANVCIDNQSKIVVQNPFDTKRGWANKEGSPHIASAFLEDGSKNLQYFMGVFANIDGVGNSRKIWENRVNLEFPDNLEAFNAISKITDFSENNWYLPAIGELGYVAMNFSLLEEKHKIAGFTLATTNLYSSSRLNASYIHYCGISTGSISHTAGNGTCAIKLFKRINENGNVGQYWGPSCGIVDEYNGNCEGVVVIPSNHNLYGGNYCAVMSLQYVNDNGFGNIKVFKMYPYDASGYVSYPPGFIPDSLDILNDKYGVDGMSNIDFNTVIVGSGGIIPTDNNTGQLCIDKVSKYYYNYGPFIVQPYMEDQSPNLEFKYELCSEFNGYENTQKMLALSKDDSWKTSDIIDCTTEEGTPYLLPGLYPTPWSSWRYHTPGTKQGDWYIGAFAEIAYVHNRSKHIAEIINRIKNNFPNSVNNTRRINTFTKITSSLTDTRLLYLSNAGELGAPEKYMSNPIFPFLNLTKAEQFVPITPEYEIVDEDPDNWQQGEEHNLKIKRLAPPSFDFEIKIDLTVNGGEASEDAFIDDGRLEFDKDITVIPNSDEFDIKFTMDGETVNDEFSKEDIEEKLIATYEIIDNDPSNWEQNSPHTLNIVRLSPTSFDREITVNISVNGGETDETNFVDNGQADFNKAISVTPSTDTLIVELIRDSESVSNAFTKSEIKEPFFDPINFDGAKFVDLGLPSGTLWATCDLGSPHPLISHFNSDYNYKFGCLTNEDIWENPDGTYSKYVAEDVTEETKIDLEDDAAHQFDPEYCTPTRAQWEELIANTRCVFKDVTSSPRYTMWTLISSKNNNKLFLGGGLDVDRSANPLMYYYGSYGPSGKPYGFIVNPHESSNNLSLKDYMWQTTGRSMTAGIRPVKYREYLYDDLTTAPNGIYILSVDNKLYDPKTWNKGSENAAGVAVITDNCRVAIAPDEFTEVSFDYYYNGFDKLPVYNTNPAAAQDFEGYYNSTELMKAIWNDNIYDESAVVRCHNYIFKNGNRGYLGSAGEYVSILQNLSAVNEALVKINGTPFTESHGGMYYQYWTSSKAYVKYFYVFQPTSNNNVVCYVSPERDQSYGMAVRPITDLYDINKNAIDIENVSNGFYILSTYNKLFDPSDWKSGYKNAVGIAVISNEHKFVISPEELTGMFGLELLPANGNKITDPSIAIKDCNGFNNTKIFKTSIDNTYQNYQDVAINKCYDYYFSNGKNGYLPALGEYKVIYDNIYYINWMLEIIGGTTFKDNSDGTNGTYWSSTIAEPYSAWAIKIINSIDWQIYEAFEDFRIRPFTTL